MTKLIVSDSMVLQSGAGWYIGRLCKEEGDPIFWEPYCRESGYFATKEEAEEALFGW